MLACDSPQNSAHCPRYASSRALPHTPWRVDSTLAIAVRAGNSRDRLVLRRWDASGAEQSPVVLLEGGYVSHLPSGDRRYVVATTREPGANVSTPYHWSVFELASGRKLTDFWSRDSAGPFAVAGPNLLRTVQPLARSGSTGLVEEPLQVRAQDLATGGTIWTRPVRDVMDRYRGIPRSGS